jgi:ABC-type transport system involved in multi-copper enzyme maturation permease subunit
MTPLLNRLFVAEFKRQWSVLVLFIPVLLGVVSYLIAFSGGRWPKTFDINRQSCIVIFTFVIPVLTSFFSAGLVAVDIKDGWLRTLLIRPVQRQQYLLVRMSSAFAMTWIAVILAGTIPIEIAAYVLDKPVDRDWLRLLELYLIFMGESVLLIGILAYFSCLLPNVLNVVVLFLWFMLAAMLENEVTALYWNNKWITIAKEYLFPGGFYIAAKSIVDKGLFAWNDLLWGFASATAFLALAFWTINYSEVDKSSE